MNLAGSVVAITGASAGIGRECALAFAARGARIAVGARRVDLLEELAATVRASGGEALAMSLDVAERDQVDAFVRAVVGRYGRLDVLVNNAGYGVRGTVAATPPEAYERLMRVNYLGTVYGCRAAVPRMIRQGSGVIINVSSIVGHRALPTGGAYAATKAAQISLTEALRVELRGTGVHACTCTRSAPRPSSARCRRVSPGTRRRSRSGRSNPRGRWRRRSSAARSARAPRSTRTGRRGGSCG